jgi:hypothetical protein
LVARGPFVCRHGLRVFKRAAGLEVGGEAVEEAFGWAKTVAGLRKMRHRGLVKVDWQFTLAMAAYTSSGCPNCSPRLSHEAAHISRATAAPLGAQCDLPENASATAIPIVAEARAP